MTTFEMLSQHCVMLTRGLGSTKRYRGLMSHPATARSILLSAQLPFRSRANLVVLTSSGGSTDLRPSLANTVDLTSPGRPTDVQPSPRRGSGALARRTLTSPSGALIFSTSVCGVALITLRSGRLVYFSRSLSDGAADQLSLRGLLVDWATSA